MVRRRPLSRSVRGQDDQKSNMKEPLARSHRGPLTRSQNGIKGSQRTTGVTKQQGKRGTNMKMKRTKLTQGKIKVNKSKPAVSNKKYLRAKTLNLKAKTPVESGQENTSVSGIASTTPVLQSTICVSTKERSFHVHEIIIMKPGIMVVMASWGLVKAINLNEDMSLMSELMLDLWADMSQVDDNSIMFFTRRDQRKVEFVSVKPKLKVTKRIKLQNKFNLLRALSNDTLLGVRAVDRSCPLFEILDTNGIPLMTWEPAIKTHDPNFLLVNRGKYIVVIDDVKKAIFCFHPSGKVVFVYEGAENNYFSEPMDDFQKKQFSLVNPCCIASDSKGNIYIADASSRLIVKIDPNGNFVENILHLKALAHEKYDLHIQFDEKDRLFVADTGDESGSIMVYTL